MACCSCVSHDGHLNSLGGAFKIESSVCPGYELVWGKSRLPSLLFNHLIRFTHEIHAEGRTLHRFNTNPPLPLTPTHNSFILITWTLFQSAC